MMYTIKNCKRISRKTFAAVLALLAGSMLVDEGAVAASASHLGLTDIVDLAELIEDKTQTEYGITENETETDDRKEETETEEETERLTSMSVCVTEEMPYAGYSAISGGSAILYENHGEDALDITVCVNAGHGTEGGTWVKVLCHPDGSPKLVSGSTSAGSLEAVAVSTGTVFLDGTAEADVTLAEALLFRDRLLDTGYNVLMIRENEDVQLDNIARTVLANSYADCHIALHWDSTDFDKGAFYIQVPDVESYKSMEPVASYWNVHDALGECLISGLQTVGMSIYGSGSVQLDLVQTSYSTVPSVDIELGDRSSDHSEYTLGQIADGLLAGVNQFFGVNNIE